MEVQDASEGMVLRLTGEVLSIAAPEEVFLLNDYDPQQSGFGSASRGPFGFGVAEASLILLPIVYELFEAFFKEAKEEMAHNVVALAKRYLSRLVNQPADVPANLRAEIGAYLASNGVPKERLADSTRAIVDVLARHAKELSQ